MNGYIPHRLVAETKLIRMKLHKPDTTPWTTREDLVVRIVSPEMASEKLGRTVASVEKRRIELGLDAYESHRKSCGKPKAV